MKNNDLLLRLAGLLLSLLLSFNGFALSAQSALGEQPLSKIAIEKATVAIRDSIFIKASPIVLGLNGEDTEWVDVEIVNDEPSNSDWVGVFSPAKFNGSICYMENNPKEQAPHICTAPVKYQFSNSSNADYSKTGKASLRLQLINQRADFSVALFGGGLSNPKLMAVSNSVSFVNPEAPLYPRLAQGKAWDEMTVTWTSGYNIDKAIPFVEWGWKGHKKRQSSAGTLTFSRNSMCGDFEGFVSDDKINIFAAGVPKLELFNTFGSGSSKLVSNKRT